MSLHRAVSRPAIRRIIAEEAQRQGLTSEAFLARCRAIALAHPRQDAMRRVRAETGASYELIGQMFGRDHSTITAGIRASALRQQGSEQ